MLVAVPARVALGMEEIYAKFVSQKISKTRWRPVPAGSLQTADTFATGSWDNEVPPLPGRGAPASSSRSPGISAPAPSPSSSSRSFLPLESLSRLPGTAEPSTVCLSLQFCVLKAPYLLSEMLLKQGLKAIQIVISERLTYISAQDKTFCFAGKSCFTVVYWRFWELGF